MENGIKISQLTEAQSTSDNMYIPVIEANANFKIKVDTLLDSVETGDSFPSGGSVGQVLKKTSTGVEWADDKDTVTTWDNLSGKPQTFTPSQHNHTKSEITDLNKATSSEDGLMSKEDKQKLDTLENVDEYILPKASSIELGGVKIGYNTNAKKYAVQLDGEDKAYVEVPWTDNDTIYNKATTTTDGLMSKEDKLKLDGLGQTGDYVLPVASEQSLGGVKTGYTTSGKNYGVQLDGDSKMYVNVPWTDTNTTYQKATTATDGLMSKEDKAKLDGITDSEDYILPTASSSTLGGIKTGYSDNDKKYGVKVDTQGKAYVEVPWNDTNTTYENATTSQDGLMSKEDKTKLDSLNQTEEYELPVASNSTLGGIKTGYTTTDKKYALQLDENNNAYVNVPWTDTNTTYINATSSNAGLMSAEDKNKLDGIKNSATNVQWQSKLQEGVNIGTITINGEPTEVYAPTSGESVTDGNTTYTFANGADGSFTVTPSDGVAQKVTIGKPSTAGTADVANSIEWNNIQSKPSEFTPSSHTHTISNITDFPSNATQYKDGLMSSSDKTKLDSLPSSIEPYEEELFIINPSTDFEISVGINYIKQQVLTNLQEALSSKVICLNVDDAVTPVNVSKSGNNMILSASFIINDSDVNDISTVNLKIDTTTRQVTMATGELTLDGSGDGTKYLSDDGTYKTIEIPEIPEIPETIQNIFILDLRDSSQATELDSSNWTIQPDTFTKLEQALLNKSIIKYIIGAVTYIANDVTFQSSSSTYSMAVTRIASDTQQSITTYELLFANVKITTSSRLLEFNTDTKQILFKQGGSTSKFLSEAGTYEEVQTSSSSLNGATLDYGSKMYFVPDNSSQKFELYASYSALVLRNSANYAGIALNYDNRSFYPSASSAALSLGTSNSKWTNLYLSGQVNQASDISLKENIKPIDAKDNLQLVEFTWKDTKEKGYGAIAQEVEKYYPELVVGEDGQKSVNYIGLHTIKIAQLENEIKELKKQIEILINK